MPALIKRVNIYAPVAIRTITPPIYGTCNDIMMTSGDILKCLCKRATVEEILSDGTKVRLTMKNYCLDNEPVVKKVDDKEKEEVKDNSILDSNFRDTNKKEEPELAVDTTIIPEFDSTKNHDINVNTVVKEDPKLAVDTTIISESDSAKDHDINIDTVVEKEPELMVDISVEVVKSDNVESGDDSKVTNTTDLNNNESVSNNNETSHTGSKKKSNNKKKTN